MNEHNWKNGNCTKCGKPYSVTWMDGAQMPPHCECGLETQQQKYVNKLKKVIAILLEEG